MTHTFTTADADRLLGLADQFLEDWAENAIQSGKPDEEYEERHAEWQAIRPLLVAAPQLLEAAWLALEELVVWGETDPDDEGMQAAISALPSPARKKAQRRPSPPAQTAQPGRNTRSPPMPAPKKPVHTTR
jgi:hypothetical protein